jgi:hypothetical protein
MVEVWIQYGYSMDTVWLWYPQNSKIFSSIALAKRKKVIESNEASTVVAPDSRIDSFLSTTK